MRRVILPRAWPPVVYVGADNAAVDAMVKKLTDSADKNTATDKAMAAQRTADAKAKYDEFTGYVSWVPGAGQFFAYGWQAFQKIGPIFAPGDGSDAPEYRDRAIALMPQLLEYGHPPFAMGVQTSWKQYAEELQADLDAFAALPDERRKACQWLGSMTKKLLEKADADVLAVASYPAIHGNLNVWPAKVADDGSYLGTQPNVINDAGEVIGKGWVYVDGKTWGVPPYEPIYIATVVAKGTGADYPTLLKACTEAWVRWWYDESGEPEGRSPNSDDKIPALQANRWGAICVAAQKVAVPKLHFDIAKLLVAQPASAPMSTPAKVATGVGAAAAAYFVGKWLLSRAVFL